MPGTLSGGSRRNFGAVQPPLGHTKLESAVRYHSMEVDDALQWRSTPRFDDTSAGVRGTQPGGAR